MFIIIMYLKILLKENKYVYYHNVFENITKGKLVESLPKFNQIVLRKPTIIRKESLTGYIFEYICFDYNVEDRDEIINLIKNIILNKIKWLYH